MPGPCLLGILNMTEDSFSDGGRYLATEAAIAHGRRLFAEGAAIVDLGAAASNPEAKAVSAADEIARLAPVVAALAEDGVPLSIDSFRPETQRWAIAQRVAFLNDIEGFSEPALYPDLARADCRLIVMHAVHGRGRAQRTDVPEAAIWQRMTTFFTARLEALTRAGIARERLILDPGMGFFLGRRAAASVRVLAGLDRLKAEFGLPVLVSVSRKSFLRALTGRADPGEQGPATLAAELHAASLGVDYIRTHDPRALCDGLRVAQALRAAQG